MSEQDNLESLSNAEIRTKCIQHGLPNVPVTESSRKIMIKKLRLSIGGGSGGVVSNLPAAAAASPKKQNRRETIAAAVKQAIENKSSEGNAANNLDAKDNQQRNKGRRPNENIVKESSIQAANAVTANETRGVKVSLAKSSAILTKVEEKKPAPPIRRKSVQPEEIGSQRSNVSRIPQRREPIQEDEETTKTTSSQKPIEDRRKSVEKALPPTQRNNAANPSMPLIKENVLLTNSLIVLESDDEEDAQLARAARIVEDSVQTRNVNPQKQQQQAQPQHQKQQQLQFQKQEQPQIPMQQLPVAVGAGSAASALYNSEFYQKQLYGGSSVTKESSDAAQQMPITSIGTGLAKETETPIASIGTKYGIGPQVPSTSSGISSNLHATTSDRYTIGSYNSPMQQRFITLATSGISMASSPYANNQKRPPTLVSANEFSDDPDDPETDQLSSPYLSNFARNLERLKSTTITERSSFRSCTPRNRRTVAAIGSCYEPEVRRPLRAEDNEVSGALKIFLQTLDRKYQIYKKMIIFFAIVTIIIIYVLFF